MKTVKLKSAGTLAVLMLVLSQLTGYAQNRITRLKSTVEPLRLGIGYAKTTNLIFPFSIKSIDRGSKDVLVQKAKGVENILQVKAGIEKLKETNLTVVTADGSLYSFLLNYTEDPAVLNLNLGTADFKGQPVALLAANSDGEAKVQVTAEKIALKQFRIRSVKDKKYEVTLMLTGIYVQDEVLYCQLALANNSNISYGIDQLRFFICDRKKARRTASQELEITPVYVAGNVKSIDAQSRQTAVFALPKFTIPDSKYLSVQLMEKNGGRHLSLKAYNRLIVNAMPLR